MILISIFAVKAETSINREIKKDASTLVIKVQIVFRLYS